MVAANSDQAPPQRSNEKCGVTIHIVELVIADGQVEVDGLAHRVSRVIACVDELFDELRGRVAVCSS